MIPGLAKRLQKLHDATQSRAGCGSKPDASDQSATGSGSASSRPRAAKRLSGKDVSFVQSPVLRLMARQVGTGKPAKLLQEVAAATVSEAGLENVTKSFCVSQCSKRFFKINVLD